MPSTIFLKNDRAHLEKTSAAYRVAVKAVRNRCLGRAVLRTSRTEFSIERNKWMLVKKRQTHGSIKASHTVYGIHCILDVGSLQVLHVVCRRPKAFSLGWHCRCSWCYSAPCREAADGPTWHGIAGISREASHAPCPHGQAWPSYWGGYSQSLAAEEEQVAYPAMRKQRKMLAGSGLGGKFTKYQHLWKFWFQNYIGRLRLPNPHENESMLLLAMEQYPRVCSHHVSSSAGKT